MDVLAILTSFFIVFILGLIGWKLYAFGRQRTKDQYERLILEAKQEYDRLSAEAEGVKKQLRASLAEVHDSQVRVLEMTEILSDPVKIFSTHLRTIDEMQTRLNDAINRVDPVAQDLKEGRRAVRRGSKQPPELIASLQQERLKLDGHRNRINEKKAFITELSRRSKDLRLDLEPVKQDIRLLDDIVKNIDGLCAPLTTEEKLIINCGQPNLSIEAALNRIERGKQAPITDRDRFNQINKSLGQRDGFG